jgi:quercetin dioxygenase-like cupin family protein
MSSIPAIDRVMVVDGTDEATCPVVPIVEGDGEARAIIWPGMGARDRSMHRVRLAPGARTIPLEHPSEAVWYVVEGAGAVTDDQGGSPQDLDPGSMVHIGAGDGYRIVAGGDGIVFVGGPCPPDPNLYAHLEGA